MSDPTPAPPAGVILRLAQPGDENALFDLVRALARFEGLQDAVTGSAEALREHLFGARPAIEAVLAEDAGRAVGYALFHPTYSTFLTRAGIYLEDLFVLESHRGRGIGRALLGEVRRVAVARGAGRLEWCVLDWNVGAITFYERFGAEVLRHWRICRVTL
jgi:GNAT superfamily N-acetyltransferase